MIVLTGIGVGANESEGERGGLNPSGRALVCAAGMIVTMAQIIWARSRSPIPWTCGRTGAASWAGSTSGRDGPHGSTRPMGSGRSPSSTISMDGSTARIAWSSNVSCPPTARPQDTSARCRRRSSSTVGRIVVTRDRNVLHLDYQLVGAGGERYYHDQAFSPPSFRIYQGPVKIATGSFGFG